MSRRVPLRRGRFDDLGLRRALSDRLLPLLVCAMAFLAALALAGAVAASSLAARWQQGAGSALTVQVPDPAAPAAGPGGSNRLDRVLEILRATSGIASARALSAEELNRLLRPWLGSDAAALSLPLPAVVAVRVAAGGDLAGLDARLAAAAPGTLVEGHDVWMTRLSDLARSLQACAGLALATVALVAVAVIAVGTRAGLSARRDAIEIVHGLGATDGWIAGRFAGRMTALAGVGAAIGAVIALPVLLGLARLAAPFAPAAAATIPAPAASPAIADWPALLADTLPGTLWLGLVLLPPAAAAIGWLTAQGTVRRWLRRLP